MHIRLHKVLQAIQAIQASPPPQPLSAHQEEPVLFHVLYSKQAPWPPCALGVCPLGVGISTAMNQGFSLVHLEPDLIAEGRNLQ